MKKQPKPVRWADTERRLRRWYADRHDAWVQGSDWASLVRLVVRMQREAQRLAKAGQKENAGAKRL